MTFFITSFSGFYSNFWYNLVHKHQQNARRYLVRLVFTAAIEAVGWMLFTTATMVGPSNAVVYTNGAALVLCTALIDVDTTLLEFLLRGAGVLAIWFFTHSASIQSPSVIANTIVIIVAILIARHWAVAIRTNFWMNFGFTVYLATAFWLTVPPDILPSYGTDPLMIGMAIVLLIAMSTVLNLYWHQRYKTFRVATRVRNNDLTTESTYDRYATHVTDTFNQAQADASVFAMAVMDIDHFRSINRRYGHMGGNAVLLQLAKVLQNTLRQHGDTTQVLRSGGQEFTIVVKKADATAALPILVSCWQTLRTHKFEYEGNQISLTASIGLTSMLPSDESVEDTYQRAAANMRISKQSGRDVITRDGQVYGLPQSGHHLELAYFGQGIYDVTGEQPRLVHNELLLREFDTDHKRWVLPKSFEISVGTQIDLLEQFIKHAPCKSVTLNLTAKEFRDATVATALTLFKQRNSELQELVIEIMDSPEARYVREISTIYHAGGIKIYIDDVGSDNSFELVNQLFPYVDGVKFAMQNLRGTNNFEQMKERIKFWTTVARQYHLEFILEGVETQYEMAFDHTTFGINLEQGYYFGKPAPAETKAA